MNKLDRATIGVYHKRKLANLDLEANCVYQFGVLPEERETAIIEQDISAFLFTLEAGYTIPGPAGARLATGIDYASGDGDPADDKYKTYDNLYYTAHKFRGFMDYFLGSNAAGLMDIMVRGKVSPAPQWLLTGDLHHFTTAADYTAFTGEATTAVGTELDLGVSTEKVRGIELTMGASVFLPTEAYAGVKDPEMGLWFYTMGTVTF
jgi:hypothetical protein